MIEYPKEFKAEGLTSVETAKKLLIESQTDYEVALAFGKAFAIQEKKITTYFKPKKAQAKAVHTDWCTAEKDALNGVSEAKRILAKKTGKYDRDMETIRREKEAKLREEAKKQGMDESLVKVRAQIEKPQGVYTRHVWRYKIVDFPVFVEYALKNNIYLLQENEKAMGEMARATKGTEFIPGVEFRDDATTVF